jgi:hypothetical protein
LPLQQSELNEQAKPFGMHEQSPENMHWTSSQSVAPSQLSSIPLPQISGGFGQSVGQSQPFSSA